MGILSSGRRIRLQFLLAVLLCLALGSEATEFMGLGEVKPGMRGVGRTVFSGTKIEEFDVEIIDILKNYTPKKNLILVRISGKVVDEAGVIEGMSGSPVYIDGKLIGALSYKLGAFAKEPIGGVTPIDEMIRIFESGDERQSMHSGSHGFVPIQTPLAIAGLHPDVVDDVKEEFSEFGFIPVSSGRAQEDLCDSAVLEPGAMIGFSLVRGDADMSWVGTLTLVEGNKVLAFGHGALLAGEVEMPLVSVYVHSVIPSSFISYKLASSSRVVGKLTQDRVAGVGGILGEETRLIPVDVRVETEGVGDTYQYELVQYKSYTPLLVNWIARNSILSSAKLIGDFTIRGDMRIVVEGDRELHLRNMFASGQAVDDFGRWVYGPIERLLNSEFEEREIKEIELNISVKEEIEKARIASVKLNKTLLKQLDTLKVEVNLIPGSGDSYVEEFEFPIEGLSKGSMLEVLIGSSDAIISQEAERWPQKFMPVAFDHLLRLIEHSGTSDELQVQIVVTDEVVQVEGVELPSLPASVRRLYHSNRVADRTAIVNGYPLFSSKRKVPHSISGFTRVEARIEGKSEEPAERPGKETK